MGNVVPIRRTTIFKLALYGSFPKILDLMEKIQETYPYQLRHMEGDGYYFTFRIECVDIVERTDMEACLIEHMDIFNVDKNIWEMQGGACLCA